MKLVQDMEAAIEVVERAAEHEARLQELEDRAAAARHYHQAHCRREASSGTRDHEAREKLHAKRLQAESDLRECRRTLGNLGVKAAERALLVIAKANANKLEDVYKIADGLVSEDPKARAAARGKLVKLVRGKAPAGRVR